jgi:pantoate--beta-alanine ligase
VDILFTPAAAEMYPDKPSVFVTVEGLSDVLEGAARPGHFRGVATVVAKLFNIVKPHAAYFGQKDFQQCVVLKRMVRELNLEVAVRVLPTVREQDGLAMSSRNSYLAPDERRKAALLNRGLSAARELYLAGETDAVRLRERVRGVILKESGITIDYIEVVDPETLAPLKKARPQAALLLAARLGRTRLIDNLVL